MTRRYELVYIFDSALDESQIDEALAKHHELLKDPENKEPVKETKHWGKRTLAYPIGKSEVGHYVIVDLHSDPVKLPEFERSLKLDAQVIRYMVVVNEGEPPRLMIHPDDRPDSDKDDDDRPRRRDDSRREGKPAATPAATAATPAAPAETTATPAAPEATTATPAAPEASDAAPATPEVSDAAPAAPEATDAAPAEPAANTEEKGDDK